MARLIINIVFWAITLGAMGTLTEATIEMGNQAVKSHQKGLISLKKLNDSLHR